MSTREYAFDVSLSAVVRVQSISEEAARRSIMRALDAARMNVVLHDGHIAVKITEASVWIDASNQPALFEIDSIPLDSTSF